MPAAIVAVATFAATPIGGIVVSLGIAVGASLLQMALTPKTDASVGAVTPIGTELSLSIGADNPVSFPLGYTANGGQLSYPGVWGNDGDTPNAYAVWEIELSDLPCPDKPVLWLNQQKCTIDWDATPVTQGYPVIEARSGGKDYLWVRYDDGTQETASAYLVGKFGTHPDRPYTSDMIGYGIAKLQVTALYNRDVFQSDPAFLFETTGIPLYNIAKDTSVGGSGSHRWDDPSTWEPSNNPIVQAYNVRRGIFYGDQWIYGGNNQRPLSAYRLPASNWIAAINECDADIDLIGGGTEKQFRSGGIVTGAMQPLDVINGLLASANAYMADVGGIYKVHVGAPGAAVYAFTDGDIVITTASNFQPFPSLDDIHNAIEADYPDPDLGWQSTPAPGRYYDDFKAEDGGRQLVASASYPWCPYKYQVQRLMVTSVQDARRFRTHTVPLPPSAWMIEPNEIMSWTSPSQGYVSKSFIVVSRSGSQNFEQLVTIKEIDGDDYDWDADDDQVVIADATLNIERPPAQVMDGWTASPAIVFDADANARKPSIEVTFVAGLVDVRAIWVQVRLAGNTTLAFSGELPYDVNSASNSSVITPVFLAKTDYEVRGKYVPYSGRPTLWSNQDVDGSEGDWLGVTTDDVPEVPPGSITVGTLSQEAQNMLLVAMQDLPSRIAQLEAQAENEASANLTDQTNKRTRTSVLKTQVGRAIAAVILEASTRVTDNEAFATALEQVSAEIENFAASGLIEFDVVASEAGTSSTIAILSGVEGVIGKATSGIYLKTELVDGVLKASILLSADVDGTGSHILVGSDEFEIYAKLS